MVSGRSSCEIFITRFQKTHFFYFKFLFPLESKKIGPALPGLSPSPLREFPREKATATDDASVGQSPLQVRSGAVAVWRTHRRGSVPRVDTERKCQTLGDLEVVRIEAVRSRGRGTLYSVHIAHYTLFYSASIYL